MIFRVPNKVGLEHYFENQKRFSEAQRLMAIEHPHLRFFVVGRKQFTQAERRKIFDRENGHCFHCGDPIQFDEFHIDHLHPIARGGSDDMDNLAASCACCNLSKSDLTLEEWGGSP